MEKKTNTKIKRRSIPPMIVGIVMPFCMVGGLLMLILGAVNHISALLGVGIALLVLGFYATPLAWVQFGQKRQYDRVVKAVMIDHILSVNSISIHADVKPNEVVVHLKKAIHLGDLKGLTLIGDSLQPLSTITHPNADEVFDMSGKDDVEFDLVCPYCGGLTVVTNTRRARCSYCGKMIEHKK